MGVPVYITDYIYTGVGLPVYITGSRVISLLGLCKTMVTCPWGRGKPSYADKAVPKADKDYIAWYASTHKGGQKPMMQVTGLGKNTIRKYQRYLKEGRPQAEGIGRQSEIRGSPARVIVEKVGERGLYF